MVAFLQSQVSYSMANGLYIGQAWFKALQVIPDVTEGFIIVMLTDGVPPVSIPQRIGDTLVQVQTAATGPDASVTSAWLAASTINAANFAGTAPADQTEMANRMASLLYTLNGDTPIP